MNIIEHPYFEIKNQGKFVKIIAESLINFNSNIDYDKNWIKCYIEVYAGVFQGKYPAEIMTTTFEIFKQKLNLLYNKLEGKAAFDDLESYCLIKVSGDGSGKLTAEIECNDNPGTYSAKLNFEIDFDQTFLKSIINQLNIITKKFPITGDFKISNNYNI